MKCPDFFNSNLINNGINSLIYTNKSTNSEINKGEYKESSFFKKSTKSLNIIALLKCN